MIITISGRAGSGKTALGKRLAKKYGLKFYSVGDMRGEIAAKKGISLEKLNEIGEKEDWTDKEVDKIIEKLGNEDDIVVDGRMAFHFIPYSFKIFLDVDFEMGSKRVFECINKGKRPDEYAKSIDEVKNELKNRMDSDYERLKKYYNINIYDLNQFDLILDTTDMTVDQLELEVEKYIEN